MVAPITLLLVRGVLIGQVLAGSQSAALSPAFDVASIRPHTGDSGGFVRPIRVEPGRFTATNATLRDLIGFAYGLQPYQRIEGDAAMLERRFDVVATATVKSTTPSGDVGPVNLMLQSLLASRFGLVVKWRDEERPVYELVWARPDRRVGTGLRRSSLNCAQLVSPTTAQLSACLLSRINGRLQAGGHRLSDLARFLTNLVEQPVLDRTGLEGPF